jgi:hypothetical protein
MSKYYRFISKEEYQNLSENEKITNINNRPLFILPEFPTAYILPEELNYNLTIEELLTSNHPRKLDFTKEIFLSYMIGIVSYDYLIELDLKKKPSMANLGWYYNENNTELCLVEYCLDKYTIDDITAIYKGDFWDWQNIETLTPLQFLKLNKRYDFLMSQITDTNAKPSKELEIFRKWGGRANTNIAFKEWVICTINVNKNKSVDELILIIKQSENDFNRE